MEISGTPTPNIAQKGQRKKMNIPSPDAPSRKNMRETIRAIKVSKSIPPSNCPHADFGFSMVTASCFGYPVSFGGPEITIKLRLDHQR